MALITASYPSTSTVSLTVTLASLATGSAGVFTTGREAAFVDNSTNRDLDHILRGRITTGTTPTASRRIIVYAFVPRIITSGTPTWPDQCTGSDAARSWTSDNVLNAATRQVAAMVIDSTSDRSYDFTGVSVAALFGGMLPSRYGIYVAHDTGAALNSTSGNHVIAYERIQADIT